MENEKILNSNERKKDHLPSRQMVPALTPRDKWVIERVAEMHETSFVQPVFEAEGILRAFFKGQLSPPAEGPADADHAGAPYAFYMLQAIGAEKLGLVPTEQLRTAFCRLLVFRAALHFASDPEALINYVRPLRDDIFNGPFVNDFFDAFQYLVVDCKRAHFYQTEKYLLQAMLALLNHESDRWIQDELGLLPAFYHFESDEYSLSGRFRVDPVLAIFYAVQKVVEEVGTPTLLAPIHYSPSVNERHLGPLAAILYSRRI